MGQEPNGPEIAAAGFRLLLYFFYFIFLISQDSSKKAVEAGGWFHICGHVGRIKLSGFS